MAKQSNPFNNFDFQSFFANAKLPGLDFETLIAAQKKNIEAFVGANQIVAEGYQAVAKRQTEVAQGAMQDAQSQMSELMASGAPEDRIAKQADLVKTGIEQAAQSMREMSEVIQKSQAEAFEILKRRMDESVDEIKDVKAA
ncbi:MAG: phasin family protein [Proteobacteria bacterium]|nr:phasin family protein [Pseudomonadota bacterium]MDA1308179.1 phasin family protein [Pseudomonadota bacterium]